MKKPKTGQILLSAALAAWLLSSPALAADTLSTIPNGEPTHFTKVIDDLPLMPGLEPIEDEDVLFDAPGSGRIAETNAMGPVDADDVYKFYKHSLPHLGWRSVDAHTYRRNNEELRIDARANQKATLVTFRVRPVAAGK